MAVAMLLSLAGEGIVLVEVHYGAGRHLGDISTENFVAGMHMNVISQVIYVVAVATVKLSVGASLLRLAGHTAWRYLIVAVMIIMGLWALSSVFVSFFLLFVEETTEPR